ncbi:MAG: hypothetical protein QOE05_651 [Actinomycetota bacterium]|nr:hypothetical protein [Actinomycetota bacterium]
MDAAEIDSFYQSVATVSFTLLGLWWVVVQLKLGAGAGDPRRRRHAYGVALFFLLPGVMSMVSSVNSDHAALWRLAFGVTAVAGLVEIALYLSTAGARAAGPLLLRVGGAVLYVVILAFAIRPELVGDLGLELAAREVEAVLVALLVVVGVNLAWFGLTESGETAGV